MKYGLIAATAAIVLGLGATAFAHKGATGVVKERMEMMKDSASQMKLIGKMVKGESDFDSSKVNGAALAIADHAKEMPKLFPKGSTGHPSEARPEIWKDWKGFEAAADTLDEEAKKLADMASNATSTTDISAQFSKVGKACVACHQNFRVKK